MKQVPKKTKKALNQPTLSSLFAKETVTKPTHEPPPALASDDPKIQDFYNSLTEKERIAHTIAVDLLGTSYDVGRTHAFQKWLRR